MILGTQWYILFNVVAGASAIPAELRAAGVNFRVRGWLWWRRIAIPAVLPYLRHRRDHRVGRLVERGASSPKWRAGADGDLEAQRARLLILPTRTEAGDFHRIVLGIAVMSLFVVVINRVFWRPLVLLRRTQVPAHGDRMRA